MIRKYAKSMECSISHFTIINTPIKLAHFPCMYLVPLSKLAAVYGIKLIVIFHYKENLLFLCKISTFFLIILNENKILFYRKIYKYVSENNR